MLDERSLKSSLTSGALLPAYVIVGDDLFLKKQALDRIIAATVEPDDEFNLFRATYETPLQQVYDEVCGFPLMADRKCVVLSEFNFEEAGKDAIEKLCEIVSASGDTCVLVLYFGTTEIDYKKNDKYNTVVSAVTAAGGDVVRLDHKTSGELAKWLVSSAKKRNALLSPKNAAYIVEICSADINRLNGEITKLCSFAGEGEITREMIDSICVKTVEASVFELAEKIIRGDTAAAMKHLDDLFYMNTEHMSVFYNITSAFVDMYRALAAKQAGRPYDKAAEAFKMGKTAFRLGKAAAHLGKFDEKKLALSFDALLICETELKSNSADKRVPLEKLIVRLVYIMKTGEAL